MAGSMDRDPGSSDRSIQQDLEIDAICLRFEQQCRAGEQPSIEQFLALASPALRSSLLRRLLLIEIGWRRQCGLRPVIDEYAERFADDRRLIDDVFRVQLETIDGSTPRPSLADARPEPISSTDSAYHGRFLPGTRLGDRYRVVSLIGRGGMGEVYRADDLKLGQTVALKFLPTQWAADPRRRERLLTEVRLARQIAHPSVCRVYDIGEIDGQQFLSMEFIDGEDLRSLIRRIGRLPSRKGIQIAQQLCAGLAAAHDRGVLHRDLKPANIMIDGRGQARITDFGLARPTDAARLIAERGGTPAYMAPEQLLHNETTVQSDLYALGLVLYEVFTGRPVHHARTVEDLVELHERAEPLVASSPAADLDIAVEDAIQRCLERDPSLRPRSARAVSALMPGGDPLEAAITAHETPSPELVAAGGASGTLSPRVALLGLAGSLVGLAVSVFLADRTSAPAFVRLKPPEVLADAARTKLREVGWHGPGHMPADSAFGFAYSASFQQGNIESRPDALHFWYRSSPAPMAATSLNSFGRIDEQDPPSVVPGMANVQLDGSGRLLQLICIPHATLPESAVAASSSEMAERWAAVLSKQTGQALESFTTVDAPWTPPVYCEQRVTWVPNRELSRASEVDRVEAAFLGGRPVYVRVVFPWSSPSPLAPPPARGRWPMLIQHAVYYGLSMLAAALAWHNVRMGRGDRRGAFRLGVFYLVAQWLGWLFQADHVLASEEWLIFTFATGDALFHAARVWLVYLAIEPFVRRLWPQSLVSWNRLMLGRWRDPLVGRDVGIGLLVGFPCLFVLQAKGVIPYWLGLGDARPYWVFEPVLRGAAATAGAIIATPMAAFNSVIVIFFSFFLLHWLLKTAGRTMVAFTLVWTTLLTVFYPGHPALSLVLALPLPICMAMLLARCGLLAAVAFMLTQYLQMNAPLTADVTRWYFDQGMMGVLAFVALAVYACRTALGGQKLFQDPVLARS